MISTLHQINTLNLIFNVAFGIFKLFSPKQQSRSRHGVSLAHIILIQSQLVFALSPQYCVLRSEQQMSVVQSLVWPDRGSNPRDTTIEASTLIMTIIPQMWYYQWGSPIPFPTGGACVLSVIRFQDGGRRSAGGSVPKLEYDILRRNATTNVRKTYLIERYILH